MKIKLLILIIYFPFFTKVNSQNVEQLINAPFDNDQFGSTAINGDFMYIAGEYLGKIYKIDLTDPASGLITVIENLSAPSDLVFNNDDLYIAEFGGHKISMINVADALPTLTTITTTNQFQGPIGLAIKGDHLYYSLNYDSIYKIDINDNTASPQLVIDGLNPIFDIEFINNELFCARGLKISKIDISSTTITYSDIIDNIYDVEKLTSNEGFLYYNSDFDKISKIDITANNPNPTTVLTNLNIPYGLTFNNNCLYFTENVKVFKSCEVLSLENFSSEFSNIYIYPNPTRHSITIKNIKKKEYYSIYNVLGLHIKSGIINDNTEINVANLVSGVYFLKFKNGSNLKFIKE